MSGVRQERDLLGIREVPAEALWGIHTLRAIENFPLSGRSVRPALIHAYGLVKRACAQVNAGIGFLDERKAAAIEAACVEMVAGMLDRHVVVDALQGGAGTSLNMNVNEVLANRALQLLDRPLGDYDTVHPIDDVNRHQSTNDTFPTAMRLAALTELSTLEAEVLGLQEAFQRKEQEFAHIVKVGRTELQDAVLTTLGREMAAYAEACNRDRWRIAKCEERLRVVNLGGTAIGTGILAPRAFIFRAVDVLRELSGFGLARAENLVEATQNADVFVEVSGILKACAANLLKICGDLRLLSSGPDAGFGELRLPPRQAGSSIMPGKVNPVIPEAVTQAALMVCANDQAIAHAAGLGSLELNPFLPLIAEALLASLALLGQACAILRRNCVEGLAADEERCRLQVQNASASLTALVEVLGHERVEALAAEARQVGVSLRQLILDRGLMSAKQFDQCISPEHVNQLGTPLRPEDP
jgi:aspartate ammonia-lyase